MHRSAYQPNAHGISTSEHGYIVFKTNIYLGMIALASDHHSDILTHNGLEIHE